MQRGIVVLLLPVLAGLAGAVACAAGRGGRAGSGGVRAGGLGLRVRLREGYAEGAVAASPAERRGLARGRVDQGRWCGCGGEVGAAAAFAASLVFFVGGVEGWRGRVVVVRGGEEGGGDG